MKLKMEVIIQGSTLLIAYFMYNMEHCNLAMIISKTILTHTQDGVTNPINCTRFKAIKVRAMGSKTIGLAFSRHYPHRFLAINYIEILTIIPQVTQSIHVP